MTDTGTGDKAGPTLAIKPLTECSAGELIRLTSGAWAIVANDSSARRIFVISGDDAPLTYVLPGPSWFLVFDYFQTVSEPVGQRGLFKDWEVSISRPGHPEPVAVVKSPAH